MSSIVLLTLLAFLAFSWPDVAGKPIFGGFDPLTGDLNGNALAGNQGPVGQLARSGLGLVGADPALGKLFRGNKPMNAANRQLNQVSQAGNEPTGFVGKRDESNVIWNSPTYDEEKIPEGSVEKRQEPNLHWSPPAAGEQRNPEGRRFLTGPAEKRTNDLAFGQNRPAFGAVENRQEPNLNWSPPRNAQEERIPNSGFVGKRDESNVIWNSPTDEEEKIPVQSDSSAIRKYFSRLF